MESFQLYPFSQLFYERFLIHADLPRTERGATLADVAQRILEKYYTDRDGAPAPRCPLSSLCFPGREEPNQFSCTPFHPEVQSGSKKNAVIF